MRKIILTVSILFLVCLCACGNGNQTFLARIDDIDGNILSVTPDEVSMLGIKYGTIKVRIQNDTQMFDADDKNVEELEFKPNYEIFVTYNGEVCGIESEPFVIAQSIKSKSEVFVENGNKDTLKLQYEVNGTKTNVSASKMSLKDFEFTTPSEGWLVSRPQSSAVGPMILYPQSNKDLALKLTEYVLSDISTEKERIEKSTGTIEWVEKESEYFDSICYAQTDEHTYFIFASGNNMLVAELTCPSETDYYSLFISVINSIKGK